ncbi:hypothetical protein MNBD_ALPHA09-871, partial [hydrothermal vent metagenome]
MVTDTEYLIRIGTWADIPRLSEIERDAAKRFGGIKGYEFCADGAIRDEHEFQRGLDDGCLLVGETGAGTIAGFALLWRVDGNAHLTELNVERRHQGRGLGRLLASASETWARAYFDHTAPARSPTRPPPEYDLVGGRVGERAGADSVRTENA